MKQKILIIFVIFAALCLMIPAEAAKQPALTADVTAKNGTAEISYKIKNNTAFFSYQFDIFCSGSVTPAAVDGGISSPTVNLNNTKNGKKCISVAYAAASDVKKDGTLFTLTVRYNEYCELTVANVYFFSSDGTKWVPELDTAAVQIGTAAPKSTTTAPQSTAAPLPTQAATAVPTRTVNTTEAVTAAATDSTSAAGTVIYSIHPNEAPVTASTAANTQGSTRTATESAFTQESAEYESTVPANESSIYANENTDAANETAASAAGVTTAQGTQSSTNAAPLAIAAAIIGAALIAVVLIVKKRKGNAN